MKTIIEILVIAALLYALHYFGLLPSLPSGEVVAYHARGLLATAGIVFGAAILTGVVVWVWQYVSWHLTLRRIRREHERARRAAIWRIHPDGRWS